MQKTWTIIFILIFLTGVQHISVQAQRDNPNVFQIIVDNCQHPQTLTGFRVKDLKGIVTALHGVVGCIGGNIRARVGGTSHNYINNLHISRVDIERDVVLLTSYESGNGKSDGFRTSNQRADSGKVSVIGYPLGMNEQLASEQLRIRANKPLIRLNSLIKDHAIRTELEERKSPDLKTSVLNIEGHLLHGHSGAPILNEEHQVVGIANGGLKDATVEIVWAIPWHAVKWQDVQQIQPELDHLAKLLTLMSFSTAASEDLLSEKLSETSAWTKGCFRA